MWLAWHEVWRTEPLIGDMVSRARSSERAVLSQALDHRVPRDEIVGLQCLVQGLRASVCLPEGALSLGHARDSLALHLSRASGTEVAERPLVPREAWGWPLVPGPRAVARGDGAGRLLSP